MAASRRRRSGGYSLAVLAALAIGVVVWFGAPAASSDAPLPRPVAEDAAAPTPVDVIGIRIAELAQSLSLPEKISRLMVVHCASTDPGTVTSCAAAAGASGVILMGDNIGPDPAAVRALTAALPAEAGFAPIVAIDEEGGDVTRLPWDALPGGAELAAAPVDATTAAFTARAQLLDEVGVNVNFGIVADVTDNPRSFLYSRVLGHSPDASAERVRAAVDAELTGSGGAVASTLKHFPGHGGAAGNSHQVIPVDGSSIEAWQAGAALPFVAGIEAGAELVMMSHVSFAAVDQAPASLSHAWHSVLREQLGFQGVIVTDDLLMLRANGLAEYADPAANALRALQAGSDLLLWVLPADPASVGVDLQAMVNSIAGAVQSGQLPVERIDESFERVMRLRASFTPEF